jgi:lysophospholipase L1-like esterase
LLLLISLGVLEIGLRLALGGMEHGPIYDFTEPEPGDGRCVRLKPGAEVEFTGLYLRIPPVRTEVNGLGYRGPERLRAKPPDTLRVAAVGDSFVYGLSVETAQSLPAQLETELAGRVKGPIEVLNFGIPGANIEDTVAQTRYFALRWHPDLVVFFLFFNDLDESFCSWGEGLWSYVRPAAHYVYLARLPVMAAILLPDRSPDEVQMPRLRRGLADLKRISREAGAGLAVVVLGDPISPPWEVMPPEPAKAIAETMAQLEIPWLDARAWLWGETDARLPTIPRDFHLTPQGNRVGAARVAEWLAESQLLVWSRAIR